MLKRVQAAKCIQYYVREWSAGRWLAAVAIQERWQDRAAARAAARVVVCQSDGQPVWKSYICLVNELRLEDLLATVRERSP